MVKLADKQPETRNLLDGESVEVKGSAAKPYVIKNIGGVYSCTCPAWRQQSTGVIRSCKHIRKLRGDAAEEIRLGSKLPVPVKDKTKVTAPPVLLANNWTADTDPTGWYMSEKLDGVRAWWDGKEFISRLGNTYYAPAWFKAEMPKCVLDGELWLGRKQFQKCVSIVRRQDESDEWKSVKYLVFDAPSSALFEIRYEDVVNIIGIQHYKSANSIGMIGYLKQTVCKNKAHMLRELAAVEAIGGEGLMLRQPGSLYEAGRSSTLLKVKSFLDADAEVIGYEKGKGKHKGRLGSLLVKMANGVEFSVGTGLSDEEREDPPAIGSTILFQYQELSDGGVPRFPSYLGVRADG